MKGNAKSKRMLLLSVFLGLICAGLGAADEPIGAVLSLDGGGIQLIDPVSMSISDNFLRHELGSIEGGLLDVVLTSDAKTAIVSNFGDARIYFIDISGGFNAVPVMKGKGYSLIFAEDLALTPDDKYVMVTDGFFNNWIMVFDVATRERVIVKYLGYWEAQSIDVTADGKHVLVSDFWAGRIHSYDFDSENPTLTYRQSRILQGAPLNMAISPDGRTVLVMCAFSGGIIPVFYIDSNGDLCDKGGLAVPTKDFQSAVFSSDGTKAYAISNNENGTYIYELNVLAPGQVTLGNVKKLPGPRGIGGFFGVDTLALDPSNNYLFVSNPTGNEPPKRYLTVLSTETLEPVYVMETFGECTGINFGTISHPEED